jgi:hypothetical protein
MLICKPTPSVSTSGRTSPKCSTFSLSSLCQSKRKNIADPTTVNDPKKRRLAPLPSDLGADAEYGDVATASVLENWIDEAERRTWFLFESVRQG